ncbi:lycopene cyclase domain-containing protein [Microbacterium sp. 179-B 1A2 NHS]|uniref:lycopene cyclase domain-containing protein n=1 Tax=Microbacterium sp. 179-B 1A2 NHS TaxID=3142383 RepID=UPI0039A20B57
MTYLLIVIPFALATAAVALATARLPRFGHRMRASAYGALALCILTAVFDNLMIAAGLFTYPEHHISGIRIGLAPIEDFAYPVCAAFAVPAVLTLLAPRKERV